MRTRLTQWMTRLAFVLVGSSCNCDPPPPAPAEDPEVPAPSSPSPFPVPSGEAGDTAYGQALDRLDRLMRERIRQAELHPTSSTRWETVGADYVDRAGLTGDYEDYERAGQALARGFEHAPEMGGPLLTRAHLHFTLHRLDLAEADLDVAERRILTPPARLAQIRAVRADIAWHRGQFEEAMRMHRESEEGFSSSSSAFRIAYDLWQTAQFAEAERWLGTALARVPESNARTRAWMNLQMGLIDIDRGRWEEALVHYREADALFDGWWLVHEHIAEALVETGELDEAEERYRDVVARTDNPELIDALADLLEQRGQAEEATAMRARAEARFEEQLEQLPEAAYGHALEHFLMHGTSERALELAEANHRLRPGGEATVRLTQALVRAGRLEDAKARIEPLLATPYRTAEMHATAALVLRASGDTEAATAQEGLAREIDPGAMEGVGWLAAALD